jgi:transposase
MSNFRPTDRRTGFLMPPSVEDWLPQRHLARFAVEGVDGPDLRAMSGVCRGSGSASYHPAVLLGLLVYGYAVGAFSSRRLERATYDSVAFRVIAANDHPDHDTIATFQRRFLTEIAALFVEVLKLVSEMTAIHQPGHFQRREQGRPPVTVNRRISDYGTVFAIIAQSSRSLQCRFSVAVRHNFLMAVFKTQYGRSDPFAARLVAERTAGRKRPRWSRATRGANAATDPQPQRGLGPVIN